MTEGSFDVRLPGKVVLVTGGTKGLGRAIAEAFLRAGAQVIVCARREPASVPQAGERQAEFIACDVRKADACQALVSSVVARHGGLDILVNNAGGSPAAEAASASSRFSEAIIALNLLAPLHMSQAVHAAMCSQREGGVIINIASVAGRRPAPGTAAYGAAKAGLLHLTQSLAQEWGPRIRVNAIVVGLVETEQTEMTYGSRAAQAELAASLPLRRLGRGADVAGAALFLASPAAAYVSGAALDVHGGGEPPHFLDIVRRHASQA